MEDLSWEIMQLRRQWNSIFQVLKEKKNCQPIIFERHLSFKNKGKIKTFSDIQKLEELIISVLTLKEKLMGILQVEGKWY